MNKRATIWRKGGFLLALLMLPTVLFSQAFYDGFESGSYTPTWTDGTTGFTKTVTTNAPAVGSYCFEISGGFSDHYQGIIGNFTPAVATSVSWRVKSSTSAYVGYVVVGDANCSSNNGMVFSRISSSTTLNFYANGTTQYDFPIALNTWYEVTLQNIDWVNKEFDIYIDGALQYANFPFRDPNTADLSQIHVYNFNAGTAFIDEFSVSTVPPCAVPPTAVCQDATVYLDGTGNASIVGSDLDGGSIDNCSTAGLTFNASQTAFTCADVSSGAAPTDALIITGVIDGPLTGGTPKAVELYAAADIPDLSLYGIGSANNGGGTDGVEYGFPADAVTAGQFIYLATDSLEFNNWFGFYPNYTHPSATNINGDDAIELFYDTTTVVDVFGDINLDGTGQPWEHLDGWTYRNNATGPDGNTFVLANWSFSGVDALDGETSNASAATPFPVGTYVPAASGTAVTLTVMDGNSNSANCMATVTVLDTISPTASALSPISVECLADVPAADILVVTASDNCGVTTVTWAGDVSDGLSCPETITRTYTVDDGHGNSIDVVQTITVNDITAPTASNPPSIYVECPGVVPAVDILEVNDEVDNCTLAPVVAHVSDVSDGLSCPETITRTYSVTDDCGNTINVEQLIVIGDTTAPVPDLQLTAIGSYCEIVNPPVPTATDACDMGLDGVPDVTFPITTLGTTTVTWTYTDACGNTSFQTQDMIVNPLDTATTVSGLTISSTLSGASSYQWIDCSDNSPIPGETGQDFTATANGDYAVIVTYENCSDTSACVNINNVSLGDLTIETLVLYPNPTQNGIFTINYDGVIAEITVIDMVGRKVNVPTKVSEGKVDGSELASGKYTVQIVTEDGKKMLGTIIVQK